MRDIQILILCLLLLFAGCRGAVEERIHKLQNQTYTDQAAALLENYAEGRPLGSESTDFDRLINLIKEESPENATIVEEAFNSIQSNPGSRKSVAKKALEQLKSSTTKDVEATSS